MKLIIPMIVLVLFFLFLFTLVSIPVNKAVENDSVDCLLDRNPITCVEIKKMNMKE